MGEKYSVAVKGAALGQNGLADRAGWLTVYHVDLLTREYTGASYEYLMVGTGLPADSYADAPDLPPAGQALRRRADGEGWEHVSDYRGQTAYRTTDGQSQAVTVLGELPDELTLLAPVTAYDQWDGVAWVTDTAAQQAAATAEAQRELTARKSLATARLAELTYAVDLAMATEAEQAAMTAWKTYLVQLSRIDTATAPDIDWPAVPAA
ncbi:tail fiber assembly protein [Dickeya solani]|uniref:Tail fiber assembly protein n=1 Tax=Dickeya solani TaxID=1089444 RepID=A0ABU4EE88_9GAMM|nr:tail fiber assembly protein [Dickeya solani]MCA7001640.1 tail fiber assembly protein [Dickeya solani]MCZ0821074.1 tail fiber assembly protein [Dickeya solani]MDV6997449.1 tail fiber assembly protein [Dickeya solani]MDV7003053.1 tail fiber assembly protein [Dickeya solani]MDV7040255.1 tail fiber assembly protein [Dickeya solani]